MNPTTTVIINPRDRYSGLRECVETLYRYTPEPFELWVLDLGYPREVIDPVREFLAGRGEARSTTGPAGSGRVAGGLR